MAFHNPASKFERALRAHLIAQGKGTKENTFISNDSRSRSILPNRTIQVSSFTPTRRHRPEGDCQVMIVHKTEAVEQPDSADPESRRMDMDAWLGDTLDSMSCGDSQSLNQIADAITEAGRALAVTDGTEAGDADAARNADMVDFRCDHISQGTPLLTRGHDEGSANCWVEVLNYSAFVSHASVVPKDD